MSEEQARLLATAERHEQQIKTLFKQQEELAKLTDSVRELALCVREVVVKLGDVEGRLGTIEEERRSRARSIWACAVSGVMGAIISYLMAAVFF